MKSIMIAVVLGWDRRPSLFQYDVIVVSHELGIGIRFFIFRTKVILFICVRT